MSNSIAITPRDKITRVVLKSGAREALDFDDYFQALVRHMGRDWGDLDEHEWKMSDEALEFGGRIRSEYIAKCGTRFLIITEKRRSVTTILLPEEA